MGREHFRGQTAPVSDRPWASPRHNQASQWIRRLTSKLSSRAQGWSASAQTPRDLPLLLKGPKADTCTCFPVLYRRLRCPINSTPNQPHHRVPSLTAEVFAGPAGAAAGKVPGLTAGGCVFPRPRPRGTLACRVACPRPRGVAERFVSSDV